MSGLNTSNLGNLMASTLNDVKFIKSIAHLSLEMQAEQHESRRRVAAIKAMVDNRPPYKSLNIREARGIIRESQKNNGRINGWYQPKGE